jgi:dihydroorotate dehydrogenase
MQIANSFEVPLPPQRGGWIDGAVRMLSSAYRLARPLLHALDAERAHRLALWAFRFVPMRRSPATDDPVLKCRVWDLDFPNPIGLAAGFDKDAEIFDALLSLGFGFVEVGTVTPRPQPGNPKPRLFRLEEDRAIINRFGFNSLGLAPFKEHLRRARSTAGGIVGANVGKNRDSTDAAADYSQGIREVCTLADYLVVNISSPNTPGLRALQAREEIEALLARVLEARRAAAGEAKAPPLLVKIAPDLTEDELGGIAEAALASRLDGLIIGNTTVDRPEGLRSPHRTEAGGLSGPPLKEKSTACLASMYRLTNGRVPLIGCGGVASGDDAYAKIRAGASLVQLYSAFVFEGPDLIPRIKAELAARLRRDGFGSVQAAVGADHR